jgi:hypothetical protein
VSERSILPFDNDTSNLCSDDDDDDADDADDGDRIAPVLSY